MAYKCLGISVLSKMPAALVRQAFCVIRCFIAPYLPLNIHKRCFHALAVTKYIEYTENRLRI